jgi:hypothetical protein
MAEQFTNHQERLAGRGEKAGEGVAQVMNADTAQASLVAHRFPGPSHIGQRRTEASGKYGGPCSLGAPPVEDLGHSKRVGHAVLPPLLGL